MQNSNREGHGLQRELTRAGKCTDNEEGAKNHKDDNRAITMCRVSLLPVLVLRFRNHAVKGGRLPISFSTIITFLTNLSLYSFISLLRSLTQLVYSSSEKTCHHPTLLSAKRRPPM